jgi:hypothetical protein
MIGVAYNLVSYEGQGMVDPSKESQVSRPVSSESTPSAHFPRTSKTAVLDRPVGIRSSLFCGVADLRDCSAARHRHPHCHTFVVGAVPFRWFSAHDRLADRGIRTVRGGSLVVYRFLNTHGCKDNT